MPPQDTNDRMPRDQDADRDRRLFTAAAIRAIEELELKRIRRSPQELADVAWQKLQYDLPLVETAELQALLDIFSASFQGKTGWPCYMLTQAALSNICSGARGAPSCAPQLTEQEQEVQEMLSQSLQDRLHGGVTDTVSQPQQQQQLQQAGQQHEQQHQTVTSQQVLYQQLAAVLLLQYVVKVASLPDQQAWQLLQAYGPEGLDDPQQHQQHQHPMPSSAPGNASENAGTAAHSANGLSSSCSIYDDTEAAELDRDSEEYEPLEAAPCHVQQQQQGPYQQDTQPLSWPVLRHKLLSLTEHVHYSLLTHEPLWQQQGAAEHLLQLLRLLGVHSHAQELQPLLHAYVGLLVDRLAAAPQDLPLLQHLWDALGLTVAAGLNQSGFRAQRSQQGLHPEAMLGLSVAAAVWQQLPGIGARRQLWRLMSDGLLPLLDVCAEQLAYSRTTQRSSATEVAAAQGCTASTGTDSITLAHVVLVSHVLELLVLGQPAGVDTAQQLTERGVIRSLVQLHRQWGCDAPGEPVRRALLLVCCSSPQTAAWVLAVPGMKQQLQQENFQLGGAFEAHGALWQLLMHSSSTTREQRPGSAAVRATLAAQQQQQLLDLLGLQCQSARQLQRQLVVLQLMVDAQLAAGGRQRLWSDVVLSGLCKLAAHVKALDGAANAQPQVAAASKPNLSDSDSDSEGDEQQAGCPSVERTQALQDQAAAGLDLEHRWSAQLLPTVLRLIKELLTQGGGKTD